MAVVRRQPQLPDAKEKTMRKRDGKRQRNRFQGTPRLGGLKMQFFSG